VKPGPETKICKAAFFFGIIKSMKMKYLSQSGYIAEYMRYLGYAKTGRRS
jgi:hypothetical protein